MICPTRLGLATAQVQLDLGWKPPKSNSTRAAIPSELCHGIAIALSWQCRGIAMALPWNGHGIAMALPWQCHGNAMALPWHCHGNAMAMPWPFHGNAMAMPRHCHDNAMAMPWHSSEGIAARVELDLGGFQPKSSWTWAVASPSRVGQINCSVKSIVLK